MELTLQISLDGDSPVGYAVDAEGVTRSFAGWLALVTAIDDLIVAKPPYTPDHDDAALPREPD